MEGSIEDEEKGRFTEGKRMTPIKESKDNQRRVEWANETKDEKI